MKIEGLSVDIIVREEKMGHRNVFVVNNERIGISDFGYSLDESISNFKKALRLYLKACPEKRKILIKDDKEFIFISRVEI